MTWSNAPLESLIDTLESGSRPKGGASIHSGEVLSIGGENILQSGGVTLEHVKRVPLAFFKRMTKGHLHADDVLINKDGAQTGKVGWYHPGRDLVACINEHVFLLRGKPSQIVQGYLYYSLLSDAGQAQIHLQISGSAQPGLKAGFAKGVIVEFPTDIREQSLIVRVLSAVDRAIEKTEALIAKQQRIKTGLMQDLLTRGIDEHGHLRSEQTHEFKDSPLGRIPVEWSAVKLDQLASRVGSGVTPTGGESVYTPEGVLFIRSQNVHFNGLRLNDVAYIPERIHLSMLRSEAFKNDVLLNITGASIGRCCRMPNIDGCANVNQHVCTIRLLDSTEATAGILAAVLESHIGQHQIAQLNAGGNREGLNYQQVRSLVLPWPGDDSEFVRIYFVIRQMADRLDASHASLGKLRLLKTGLMQDLLTGDRRVTALLEQQEKVTT